MPVDQESRGLEELEIRRRIEAAAGIERVGDPPEEGSVLLAQNIDASCPSDTPAAVMAAASLQSKPWPTESP
ncbi:MAG: hypothetical protein ABJC39_11475 [Chloroflexota bacterium]